jgi:hypothetical protein
MDNRKFRVTAFAQDSRTPVFASGGFRSEPNARNFLRRQRRKIRSGELSRVVLHRGEWGSKRVRIVEDIREWSEADDLTVAHTAFDSFRELVHAPGGYRPSLDVSDPDRRKLADYYDKEQERRFEPRRVFRYS